MVAGARSRVAVFIPRGYLELRIEEKVADKTQEVLLYCAGGTRSALAARSLRDLGYTRVASVAGGFGKWKEAGLPIVVPKTLSAEQQRRYSRHLLVPEVGEAGQQKLLASKVLLVGAGGLGSPAGLYLAAAGSAPWASSTPTWWTSPTCSARCCTRPPPWAGPRPSPRRRPSAR